ncbi:DMT family transporter [Pseudarthrobacter sp. 1G09]|uniref:DMT family transporter n=1 Tax=Pseudarthrobacter sp. 1G09 TaxID=3416178 RepID=UPI003CEE1DA3
MKWILLAGAILSGVTASLSLKAALDNPVFFIAVILGYSASFAFLAGVLRKGLGLGVAYGIWAAAGVALIALAGRVFFKETITPVMMLRLGLIIGGVLLIELGAAH